MEAKVKEEVPDKEYQPTSSERRKSSTSGKERRSPEAEEAPRVSPTGLGGPPAVLGGPPTGLGGPPGPPSPQNNGTTAPSSTESLSPPLGDSGRTAPALQRLRKFLSALLQFASDVNVDTGDRVKQLIFNLVAGTMNIEEFQAGVQECTNYPLRASVPGFLRALLPLAQRDLTQRARRAKLPPQQYIRLHEQLILEPTGEGAATDIFQHEGSLKRRSSDPFYENASTNGGHEEFPGGKRPASLFLQPSPFLYPGNTGLFDYTHSYHNYQGAADHAFDRRDGGISVRDVSSMTSLADPRPPGAGTRCDDEWRNINTMLNCILSMVEKTKRALAILQQRGVEPTENNDIKRAASEIMAAAVRQTEERVAEVRRRAEDAVNQVKRQALLELQRAVSAAEGRALDLQHSTQHPPPPPRDLSPGGAQQQNCCWNCGRKAQETCSGCNAARYCGAFCQHKDWENHHQVCSGREQKPSSLLRTSPPSNKLAPRSVTPLAPPTAPSAPAPATDRLLPLAPLLTQDRITQDRNLSDRNLTSDRLINQERTLNPDRLINQDRSLNNERLTLASLSSAQGMIGIGGKK